MTMFEYSSEEEEEELQQFIFKSQQECDHCQDPVLYTDEIFLLHVSVARPFDQNSMGFEVLLDEQEDHFFEPIILHMNCWEEIQEHIQDLQEDKPPILEGNNPVLICKTCSSLICDEEMFVTATFGELQVSKRQPNPRYTLEHFETLGSPFTICLECIASSSHEYPIWWPTLMEYLPERPPIEEEPIEEESYFGHSQSYPNSEESLRWPSPEDFRKDY